MQYEFVRPQGETFHCDSDFWCACFDLAVAFGWQPAGTLAPDTWQGEWNGCYFTSDTQGVSKDDAKALGAALHRASSSVTPARNQLRVNGSVQSLTNEQARALMHYIEKCVDSHKPNFNTFELPVDDIVLLADYVSAGFFYIYP